MVASLVRKHHPEASLPRAKTSLTRSTSHGRCHENHARAQLPRSGYVQRMFFCGRSESVLLMMTGEPHHRSTNPFGGFASPLTVATPSLIVTFSVPYCVR